MRRAERGLETKLGREPSSAETAAAAGLAPEEVDSIKRSAQVPLSLEMAVGEDKESMLGQFIADETAESPLEHATETVKLEKVPEALKRLSYRERRILQLHFGLDEQQPRTLRELAAIFELTLERVRQIEKKALVRLSAFVEMDQLGVGGYV
jgi:RNA polymerase primary sigma factor